MGNSGNNPTFPNELSLFQFPVSTGLASSVRFFNSLFIKCIQRVYMYKYRTTLQSVSISLTSLSERRKICATSGSIKVRTYFFQMVLETAFEVFLLCLLSNGTSFLTKRVLRHSCCAKQLLLSWKKKAGIFSTR